jgi:hypothetical protein
MGYIMKKMAVSLLILGMYDAGNAETHAAQKVDNDRTPLTREEIRSSGLSPEDEEAARHLDHALFGGFNPEERDDERDEAEEEQIARLAARVWRLISNEDLSFQRTAETNPPPHTPPLQAEVRQPINAPIPAQAVPEAGRITQQMVLGHSLQNTGETNPPSKTAPIQAEVRQPVNAPIPEQAVPEAGRITQQMVIDGATVYMGLSRNPAPTVETLTDSLMQYSQSTGKAWSEANCHRIAAHLIEGDEVD